MFCSKCGTQLPDTSKFCSRCGSQVAAPVQYTQPQSPAVPTPAAPPVPAPSAFPQNAAIPVPPAFSQNVTAPVIGQPQCAEEEYDPDAMDKTIAIRSHDHGDAITALPQDFAAPVFEQPLSADEEYDPDAMDRTIAIRSHDHGDVPTALPQDFAPPVFEQPLSADEEYDPDAMEKTIAIPKRHDPYGNAPEAVPPVFQQNIEPPVQPAPVMVEPVQPVQPAPAMIDPQPEVRRAIPQMPMKKKAYLAQLATPKAKKANVVSWIAFALSIVFLLLGIGNGLFSRIDHVPFWKFMMLVGDAEIEELEYQMEGLVQETEYFIERAYHAGYDEDLLNKLEKSTDAVSEKLSIWNLYCFYDALGDTGRFSDASETCMVLLIYMISVVAMFFLPLLLILLGGLLKNNGCAIAGLIFTIPAELVFGGFILLPLSIVAISFLIGSLSVINKEYRQYRRYGILN